MAEELKGLIEKIQEEGVRAAEEKAKIIEEEARREAKIIIDRAQKEAQALVEKAGADAAKMEQGGKAFLKQAARDTLLTLKGEITALLERLAVTEVRKALAGDELIKIIASLIKDNAGKGEGKIIVSLKKDDIERIEKGLLAKLGDELKKGVILRPAEDIQGGFLISYDSDKSHFDFTDSSLAEYLTAHLKPALANLLKDEAARDSMKGKDKK